jgi:hypothetical protein
MVEPQIVVLVVAGSSPVGHPVFSWSVGVMECWSHGNRFEQYSNTPLLHFCTVPVAQLDRASDFGSEGWGFESLQARDV